MSNRTRGLNLEEIKKNIEHIDKTREYPNHLDQDGEYALQSCKKLIDEVERLESEVLSLENQLEHERTWED